MELAVLDISGKEKGKIKMPEQFNEEVRDDLIKRAVLALQSHKRQRYGAKPDAGMRASAFVSKRRHKYKSTYGIGQSRTPRKVMTHRGSRFNFTGAFAPQAVSGRRAHPPKSEKEFSLKINTKERRKAIRSALSASINRELVERRGHKLPKNYPFIVEDKIQTLEKTKEVKNALVAMGLKDELKRTEKKKIRAGKGKMRGRKYKKKKGVLLVVSKDSKLLKSGKNIAGIDVCEISRINAELLAPGAEMGRITLFSEGAIKTMEEKKLFI